MTLTQAVLNDSKTATFAATQNLSSRILTGGIRPVSAGIWSAAGGAISATLQVYVYLLRTPPLADVLIGDAGYYIGGVVTPGSGVIGAWPVSTPDIYLDLNQTLRECEADAIGIQVDGTLSLTPLVSTALFDLAIGELMFMPLVNGTIS